MKVLMTLIALLALTAACTQETPVELATIDETCSYADLLVRRFVGSREMGTLQDQREWLLQGDTYTPEDTEWFWGPILLRVYEQPLKNKEDSYLDLSMRALEFRNAIIIECHKEGLLLTKDQATGEKQQRLAEVLLKEVQRKAEWAAMSAEEKEERIAEILREHTQEETK